MKLDTKYYIHTDTGILLNYLYIPLHPMINAKQLKPDCDDNEAERRPVNNLSHEIKNHKKSHSNAFHKTGRNSLFISACQGRIQEFEKGGAKLDRACEIFFSPPPHIWQ